MAGIPAREKEKGWDSSKDMWQGFPQLNDDMVGIPTRKRVGIPAKLRGCQFDKKTQKRKKKERNWYYMVCVVESFEVVCCYTSYYMNDWPYKTL